MKATLYNSEGEKKSQVELPSLFETKIREDIVSKYFEADKLIQPYASFKEAGKRQSASGRISHKRHDWKGHYGSGRSRIPRKTMSRSGKHFNWIGAEISSTRGGRRAHPPKGIGKEKKINKKEVKLAMDSAFAATGNADFIINRYSSLDKLEIKVPVVIESKLDNIKTKDMKEMLNNIFGDIIYLIIKNKEIRSGKGKLRGRKYKSNAGLLFVKEKDEKVKMKGIEIKNVDDISISDLYPLGRLTVYTEKALSELGDKK